LDLDICMLSKWRPAQTGRRIKRLPLSWAFPVAQWRSGGRGSWSPGWKGWRTRDCGGCAPVWLGWRRAARRCGRLGLSLRLGFRPGAAGL